MDTTYRIPTDNISELEKRLVKVNKRAAKLGLPLCTYEVTDTELVEKKRGDKVVSVTEISLVKINGTTPKVEGWAFVAVLEHIYEDGTFTNIIRTVPGHRDVLLSSLRTAEPWCDHCQKVRRRTDTYAVQHDDGTLKQVGSNCLGDFTGSLSPNDAARMAEWLCDLDDWATGAEDGYEGMGGGERVFEIRDYLGVVSACIGAHGWLSRGKAWEYGGVATADDAVEHMTNPRIPDNERISASTGDVMLVGSALSWVRNETPALPFEVGESDYLWNLQVACKQPYLRYKHLGIAASLIQAYQRALGDEVKRREREKLTKTSQHVGTIGKRMDLGELVIIGKNVIEGNYGATTIYAFLNEDGAVIKWFASEGKGWDIGDKVRLTGTVKKHSIYRDIKETIVTRCKESQ